MLEDSYLCEANIEAAQLIMDREWEKSKQIQNLDGRAIYLGLACFRAASALEYYNIIFYTHGGF